MILLVTRDGCTRTVHDDRSEFPHDLYVPLPPRPPSIIDPPPVETEFSTPESLRYVYKGKLYCWGA